MLAQAAGVGSHLKARTTQVAWVVHSAMWHVALEVPWRGARCRTPQGVALMCSLPRLALGRLPALADRMELVRPGRKDY